MRTLKLTKDSQKNILESLLKRSPNNYTEYESTVNEEKKGDGKLIPSMSAQM